MLSVGQPAPGFKTKDHGRDVSLADFLGRHVVLWFYPKADTPG
jgi:peroxiredoxin Q/BCP